MCRYGVEDESPVMTLGLIPHHHMIRICRFFEGSEPFTFKEKHWWKVVWRKKLTLKKRGYHNFV